MRDHPLFSFIATTALLTYFPYTAGCSWLGYIGWYVFAWTFMIFCWWVAEKIRSLKTVWE